MNFIIGFIGLFIYLIYFSYKREQAKTIERERIIENTKYNCLKDIWIKKVIDEDLEFDIKSHIHNYNNNDIVYREVIHILKSFPSFERSEVGKYGFVSYMNTHHYLMLERIYMALEGKLLYNDAMYGIQSPPVYDKQVRKEWDLYNELMRWIDTQLKQRGVEYDMKFVCGSEVDNVKYDSSKVQSIDNISPKLGGKYFWIPIIKSI